MWHRGKLNFCGVSPGFYFWFYHLQDMGAVHVIRVEFFEVTYLNIKDVRYVANSVHSYSHIVGIQIFISSCFFPQ